MARTVTLTCDWPGSTKQAKGTAHGAPVEDQAPTQYMIEGDYYEIDLCRKHRDALYEMLAPLVEVSQTYSPRHPSNVRKVLRGKGEKAFTTADIRKWLQEQGRDVPVTGRIAQSLIEEFKQAHKA